MQIYLYSYSHEEVLADGPLADAAPARLRQLRVEAARVDAAAAVPGGAVLDGEGEHDAPPAQHTAPATNRAAPGLPLLVVPLSVFVAAELLSPVTILHWK